MQVQQRISGPTPGRTEIRRACGSSAAALGLSSRPPLNCPVGPFSVTHSAAARRVPSCQLLATPGCARCDCRLHQPRLS